MVEMDKVSAAWTGKFPMNEKAILIIKITNSFFFMLPPKQ